MKAKAAACVLVCALGSTALAGCLGAPSATMTEEQASNRQFMAQVNQTMVDFQDRIDGFNDALSAGDLVGMRTQADNAFRVLDALEKLEAPEALADVKQGYVDGCAAMKEALSDYVALYGDIEGATEADPFDWGTYDSRIAEVKQDYDDGLAKLQAADEAAAAKE